MKVCLTVLVSGPMEGKKIPITIPKFVIGRAPQCNLQPGNPTISKMHCVLKLAGDKVLLEDLGSSTGTFVNDRKIAAEVQLKDGDRLKVGPLIFGVTIEVIKESVPPPPQPRVAPGTGVIPASVVAASDTKPRVTPETGVMPASAVAGAGDTTEMSARTDETVFEKKPKAENKPDEKVSTSVAAKELLKKYLRRKRNMDEPMV
jgi:pSer/pThr/pTyr-binding forkhead associated (FHA) protein